MLLRNSSARGQAKGAKDPEPRLELRDASGPEIEDKRRRFSLLLSLSLIEQEVHRLYPSV